MYAFAREYKLLYDRLIHSHDPEETSAVNMLEEISGLIEPGRRDKAYRVSDSCHVSLVPI